MKRSLSIILALAIVILSFAGCSKMEYADKELKLVIEDYYNEVYSKSDIEEYKVMYDSILNREETISIKKDSLKNATYIFYNNCIYGWLVSSLNENSDGSGVRVSYQYSADEQAKKIKEFNNEIWSIIYSSGYTDGMDMTDESNIKSILLNMYNYISSNFKVDKEISSLYECAIKEKGDSRCISTLFSACLSQIDIKSNIVYGAISTGGLYYVTEVDLDGSECYFDISGEITYSQGKGLAYFGMSASVLPKIGLVSSITYLNGKSVTFSVKTNRYYDLLEVTSYTFEDGIIIGKKANGNEVKIELY